MSVAGYVAVVGEAVADALVEPVPADGCLALRVRPGGGPANTAVALSRLGTPTRFVGRLSRGVFGGLLLAYLERSGVDVSGCVRTAEQATLAIASVDDVGQASYDFYADHTADWHWDAAELAARYPHDAVCVHAGSLALVRDPGGPLIERMLRALRAQSTISIDPNVRPNLVPASAYRAQLPAWTGLADVLRLSDEDLAHLLPGVTVEEACERWHADGVRLVVVTRGAAGAVASLDGQVVAVPAEPVALVDTVGAGDAFTGALLHWLWRHGKLGSRLDGVRIDDVRHGLTFAARVAALTCAASGADPPRADALAVGTGARG